MSEFENLQNDIQQSSLSPERKEHVLHQHISVRQKIFSLGEYKNELLSFETAVFLDIVSPPSMTASIVGVLVSGPQLQLQDSLKITFQLNRLVI